MLPNFTLAKKGYDPQEVDEYIIDLQNQLKSYKDKDNAIKNALINAEIAADNIIKNAKLKASQIKYKAEEDGIAIRQDAYKSLDHINASIVEQKKMLSAFQKDYNEILNKYLKNIDSPEYLATFNKICALEDYIESLKKSPSSAEQQHNNERIPTQDKHMKHNTTKTKTTNSKAINRDSDEEKDSIKEIDKSMTQNRRDFSDLDKDYINKKEQLEKVAFDNSEKLKELNKISFDNKQEVETKEQQLPENKDHIKHNLW